MNNLKKNNIFNSNNYKKSLPGTNKILSAYLEIVNEYVIYTIENIKIKDQMMDCILYRGLKILKHIFVILLLYTKNINLVLYHGKKAYLYFVEFIDQIGEEHGHSYLQLTSKDAVLFVYKKTIFEINNDYKSTMKISEEEKKEFKNIGSILSIFNEIIYKLIKTNKKEDYKHNIMLSIDINQKVINLYKKGKNMDILLDFIMYLSNKKLENEKYCIILHKFVSLYSKKEIKSDILNNLYKLGENIKISDIKTLF